MDPKVVVHWMKKMGRTFHAKGKASTERHRRVIVHGLLGTHLGKDSLMLWARVLETQRLERDREKGQRVPTETNL